MKRKGCLVPLGIVAALVGWAIIYTWPETHRYRMTVEVDTPQGLRTGSSVIETRYRKEIKILPDQVAGTLSVRGEAVAVDLPRGQTLFALLRGFDRLTEETLGPDKSPWRQHDSPTVAVPPKTIRNSSAGVLGDVSGLPMLVRFRNGNDPKSIERIDPTDLAASFGKGTSLKRVTLQVTDDPVTMGIEKRLRWLPEYRGKMLDGSPLQHSRSLSNSLSRADFQWE